jgi:hypothetical protein
MRTGKSSINPKEKARMADIMRELSRFEPGSTARKNVAISYAQIDRLRLKRIRSAIGKKIIPIPLNERVIEYHPATGKMVWGLHPAPERIGFDATNARRDGTRYLTGADGKTITAARMAHEAIHGPIPEDHEVYCVNGDHDDLSAANLRCKPIKHVVVIKEMTDEDRAMIPDDLKERLRKLREAREAEQ